MKIGKALKRERIRLGLTQDEMIKGVITKGHYSKIERGLEGISADSLFKILFAHNIDIDNFFDQIKNDYRSKSDKEAEELERKIMTAFNNSDNAEIEECLKDVLKLSGNKIFKYRVIVAVATFRGQLDELSPKFKNKIIIEFTKKDNWIENFDCLKLLANCMQVFCAEELDECVSILLEHYTDNNYPEKMIERTAIICNNYLYYCYYYHHINEVNIRKCIKYLNDLDNNSHYMFYRIAGFFYKYLFNGQKSKAEEVKKQLISWGYESRVATWKL